MSNKGDQRARILILLDILNAETDEEHPMTEARLRARLEDCGIVAERKTILGDLHSLEDYGVDLVNRRGPGGGFFIASRKFELAELKLLVDAVQSSKFISERKSRALINKLCTMTSRHEARKLERQVYVSGRVKSENTAALYTVDTIHSAIANKCKITFRYNEWTVTKTLRPRHGGSPYTVSPYLLIWEEGYYYLVGYDEAAGIPKHFRVDKMTDTHLLEEPRAGEEVFGDFDPALYARETFGMYGGEETLVTLRCDVSLAGVVIDRFGERITMTPEGEDAFRVTVRVRVSPVFLAWVIGYGERMRILSPDSVSARLRDLALRALSEPAGDAEPAQ